MFTQPAPRQTWLPPTIYILPSTLPDATARSEIIQMVLQSANFDYPSLKKLLENTTADVLLAGDGEEYEKSIERWSEHCIKRAVCFP
jgi:hypothetical protein